MRGDRSFGSNHYNTKYKLGQESDFRYEVNSDEMATEKLAQGIRGFAADQNKLENWLKETYK